MYQPQNYRWQNGKLWCIYRHHLKVALPHCNEECFSRRDCAADGRLCRSRVAAKIFVFLISRNCREIFNFLFRQTLLKFCEIQNNFVKILCFAKFFILCFTTFYSNTVKFRKIQNNLVKILCFEKFLQCCFAATLCRSGGGGGGGSGEGGGSAGTALGHLPC